MNEFKVNEYLTLKLEGKSTVIYVKGEEFQQCKFLLLNISVDEITSLNEIESIDEAAERLDKSLEKHHNHKITPEEEFWGHCSNIQVWAEHDYNTRLLSSNLAFPLLKRLTETGDPLAKKVFKEEIAERIKSGYPPIIKYLLKNRYLKNFSEEEMEFLLDGCEFVEFRGKKAFLIEGILDLSHKGMSDLEEIKNLHNLTSLENLILKVNKLKTIPASIGNFSCLKELYLQENWLKEIPESIGNLSFLKVLNLRENKLTSIPSSICNLTSLKYLSLGVNQIETLPDCFESFTKLEELTLQHNHLKTIPSSIGKIESLRELHLSANGLRELPDSIGNLKSLQFLDLESNELEELPDSIKKLTSLKELYLDDNPLCEETNSNTQEIIEYLRKNGVEVDMEEY